VEDGGSRKQSRRTGFFKFTHGFVVLILVTRCLPYTDGAMDIALSVSISTADFCIAFQSTARGTTIEIVSMLRNALSLHYFGSAVIRANNQATLGPGKAWLCAFFSHPISRGPVSDQPDLSQAGIASPGDLATLGSDKLADAERPAYIEAD
jgi:hypothetical protein